MEAPLQKMECLNCHRPFSGNENKKFCSDKCKNTFHNAKRKTEIREIGAVITILKTNRRIISELLNGKDIKSVSEQNLLDKGYVFRYHTHRRINKSDSKEYIFCFDYGYLSMNNGWYKILKAFKEDL